MEISEISNDFDFNLRGGVLIIGSLLWDDLPIRVKWRKRFLKFDDKFFVQAPIRYGRISSSWKFTYTMVLSEECKNFDKIGRAYFVPFNNNPVNRESLCEQAFELIKSERKKESVSKFFNWDWGAIAISLNPKLSNSETKKILTFWSIHYNKKHVCEKYSFNNEINVIDEKGILNFNWTKELDNFDFLITTVIIPKNINEDKNEYPSSIEIAQRLIETNHVIYFNRNIELGISTFQDAEINELLQKNNNSPFHPDNASVRH
jgi:hypothetical protein